VTDASERLEDGERTLAVLYGGATGGTALRPFAVAPSAGKPRLLVPADAPRAAAAALRAYGGRLSAKATYSAAGYRALVTATRGAVLRPAYVAARRPDADIESVLGEIFGREVRVAIHLTPARANRKPILQVLDPDGATPIGFAKLATNELTTGLLADEAAALTRLAAAPDLSFRVPTVLHDGTFEGHRLLVTGPLATWGKGRLPKPREIIRAGSEIAGLDPITQSAIGTSAFWRRLHDDVTSVADPATRERIEATGTRIESAIGAQVIDFGVGHGDFSPWNMWFTGHRLLIWDWERLASDLPVGSDLVHYKLQEALTRAGQPPRAAADSVLAAAPDPAVAVLHLFALAVRYAKDDQAGAGATIGDATDWLLPAIDAALAGGGR
jgi:hypothetical protein